MFILFSGEYNGKWIFNSVSEEKESAIKNQVPSKNYIKVRAELSFH